jgi:hypothetical protein
MEGWSPVRKFQVAGFLRRGAGGRVARVDADGDDLEVGAGLQGQNVQRTRQAVDRQRAQHRAVVVREHQHHRPLAKIVAEAHRAPGLVAQRRVERQPFVEVLVESDLTQRLRQL